MEGKKAEILLGVIKIIDEAIESCTGYVVLQAHTIGAKPNIQDEAAAWLFIEEMKELKYKYMPTPEPT